MYVTEKKYAQAMSVLHNSSAYSSVNKMEKLKYFIQSAKIKDGKKWIENYKQLLKETK